MIFVKIEISDKIKPGWVPWQQRGNYFLTRLPPRLESSRRTSHEKAIKMPVLDNWCHDDDDDDDDDDDGDDNDDDEEDDDTDDDDSGSLSWKA